MDHSKIIVAEELLALSGEVLAESISVKHNWNADDFDAGYIKGLKDAYEKVNEMIYARLEKILSELKQK